MNGCHDKLFMGSEGLRGGGALTSAGPIGGYQWSVNNIKIWQDTSQDRNDHSVGEHLGGELAFKLGWGCVAANSQNWCQLAAFCKLPLGAMVVQHLCHAAQGTKARLGTCSSFLMKHVVKSS